VLTLVLDLDVCVVEKAQIVERVPEVIRRGGRLVQNERRSVTLIS